MIAFIEDSPEDFALFSKPLREHEISHFSLLEDFETSNDNFDVVIADLSLPISDPNQVLNAIRNKNPVILTGLAKETFEELRAKLNKGGFDHVLSKDIGPYAFGKYIKEHFQ